MEATRDVAPAILTRLPIDSLISLAKTTTLTSVEGMTDIWNDKLVEMGYDCVPCAQGLYFLVMSQPDKTKLLTAAMSLGVIEHVTAVMKRYNLTEDVLASVVRDISQPLSGAIYELAVKALKNQSYKPTQYVSYPNTYNLLAETFDKNDVERFTDAVRAKQLQSYPTLLDTCLSLCEKFVVRPTAIIWQYISDHSSANLIESPLIYMLADAVLNDTFYIEDKEAGAFYPQVKELADNNPSLYAGSFFFLACALGTEEAITDIENFWSQHLLALMESPYFENLYNYIWALDDEYQQPGIIKAIKEAAIAKGVLFELVMKIVKSEDWEDNLLYTWFIEDIDVVILPEHWIEFLSAADGMFLSGVHESKHHAGIPKEVVDDFVEKALLSEGN